MPRRMKVTQAPPTQPPPKPVDAAVSARARSCYRDKNGVLVITKLGPPMSITVSQAEVS